MFNVFFTKVFVEIDKQSGNTKKNIVVGTFFYSLPNADFKELLLHLDNLLERLNRENN